MPISSFANSVSQSYDGTILKPSIIRTSSGLTDDRYGLQQRLKQVNDIYLFDQ